MAAIFKREFKSYFQSVIGWLFIAVTLCLYGLYFVVYNLSYGYAYISYSLSAITFIFLITVPVLTMRVFAEERNKKTDQLILTSPVSLGKIVFAKFLAMVAVFSIAIAVIALSPLLLKALGSAPLKESYVAILGFWLYGVTCIAIGTFVSSLTESQVISAVITFGLLFLGYMMGGITNLISTSGNILTKILGCYDLTAHLDKFCSGVLDLTGVVYYVSVTVLFLFLTAQSIQKRRWSMSRKKIGLGVFSTGMVVFGIAVAVVLNLAVGTLPSTLTQVDVTNEKLYTITKDTKDYLADLKEDVTIYVLSAKSSLESQDTTLFAMLEKYKDASSHISVVYKDPKVYPQFYTNYTDTAPSANSLIVEGANRSKVVDYSDLYETSVDYSTYSQQTTGYDGEGQLTSAIAYVENENMPVVYEITGHGETEFSGSFSEALEKANIDVSQLTLLKEDSIPDDAEAVIINGPTSDFSADDAKKVSDYLAAGGKAFITVTYTDKELPNFESILAEYQIQLEKGMVVEQDKNSYYQNPFYLLPAIASSEWTSSVSGSYIFAPYCRGIVHPATEEDADISYTDLLTSSSTSFAKTDVANMASYDKEDGDVDGPFVIGLEAEKKVDDDNTTKLFVFASTTMFSDDADQMVSGSNAKLFSSCVSSFAGDEDGSSIVIPVKEYDTAKVTVSSMTVILAAVGFVVVLPLVLLGTGIGIWAVRRKK